MRLIFIRTEKKEMREKEQRDAAVNIQQGEPCRVSGFYMSLSIYLSHLSIYRVEKRESNPFCLHTEVAGLNMWERRELPVANANDPSG
jgi:hypothetical protein